MRVPSGDEAGNCVGQRRAHYSQNPLSFTWFSRLFRSGAIEQYLALPGVACERCRAPKLRAGFIETAKFEQEIATDTRQKMIILKRGYRRQTIHDLKAGGRAECHRDCDRPIQLYYRGRRNPGELGIERSDALPIGVFRNAGSRMTSGDGGLERVGTCGAAWNALRTI